MYLVCENKKKKIITSCKREKSKFEKDRILHPQDRKFNFIPIFNK